MKETLLYTGNIDAIATSLASVSENLCVQLSMPKKTLITRTLNRHRQKNNMNDLPVLPHTKKFEVPEELKDFLIYKTGEKIHFLKAIAHLPWRETLWEEWELFCLRFDFRILVLVFHY